MRAVIYARYSSDSQRAALIEDQLRLCKEFIARQGWRLQQVYRDAAMSSASLLRPGYQALLESGAPSQLRRDRRGARPAVPRPGGRRRVLQAMPVRRRADRHLGRGRDLRAACRTQGHDECPIPQGLRRQDPAGPAGPLEAGASGGGIIPTATTWCPRWRGVASAGSTRPRLPSCAASSRSTATACRPNASR